MVPELEDWELHELDTSLPTWMNQVGSSVAEDYKPIKVLGDVFVEMSSDPALLVQAIQAALSNGVSVHFVSA